MSWALLLAAQAAAAPATPMAEPPGASASMSAIGAIPGGADPRRPVSLWVGSDEPLNFRFGYAMAARLAASPTLRPAFPAGAAAFRIVLVDLPRPRGPDGRFTYTVEVRRVAEKEGAHFLARHAGACTTTTIDSCASSVMDRIAQKLGG